MIQQRVLSAVSRATGVSVGDIKGTCKATLHVRARVMAVMILLEEGLTRAQAVAALGRVNGYDVPYALGLFNKWITSHRQFKREYLEAINILENED